MTFFIKCQTETVVDLQCLLESRYLIYMEWWISEAVIIPRVNLPNNPTLKIDLNWIPIKEVIFALFISQTGTNVGRLSG